MAAEPQGPEEAPAPQTSAPAVSTGPVAPAVPPDTGYTESGVPTLEGLRDKIESRYGTALGGTELAAETPEARAAAEQFEDRQRAAAEKLEQIRAAMRDDRA